MAAVLKAEKYEWVHKLIKLVKGVKLGTMAQTATGETRHLFTEHEIKVIKALIRNRFNIAHTAKEFKVHESSIRNCVIGNKWSKTKGVIGKLELYHQGLPVWDK